MTPTSDEWFRTLLESAPDAMIIIDVEGVIAIANRQAEVMFGISRDGMIGSKLETLIPARARERHVAHRTGYAADPHVRPMGIDMDLAGRRADGSEFPVEISLSPVESEDGRYVCSVIRDVTSRKEMELEIIDARRAAERANKANTAFLAAASHDLRQPVQALSLLSGALRRTVKEPLALEMIESQQHSIDAMTNLLNSLLDISRLDAGAVHPEFEEFSMQRLFDRLSAEFARQAIQKGLYFDTEPCKTIVRSDPNLLAEIIQNFVSNAVRYTDKGSVHLSCIERGENLSIRVRDTGIGIDADQLDEIWNEFHQIKTPGQEKEGFGLGLAIVRRLADLLGHHVEVQSDPGCGSCFCILVPIVGMQAERVVSEQVNADGADAQPASGMILLIEDDVKVANAWGLLLEAEGYRVATAASAKEADAVANHLDTVPDLIISDFHLLDGSTGIQAVQGIREHFSADIPAFIITGDTSKIVQDARSLANSILMNKPVNIDDLLNLARKAIEEGKLS